ncbi:uncharacterized protein LOC133532210 isoform X3 [Cydia pomonella]|uniref:uncharacterized protein LOC133532210 isoform X3 n=1 Tax=Cydia pomonella TaxID=82600 RepID=UPI002ADD3A3A|nr:uncharacterized protein LOC133532210 isoform X3 [Cydia pomonella]
MEQPGSSFSSSEIPSDELELMRLVISCIRESTMVSTAQGPALEGPVCRVIALQARQRYQTVYTMWCDLRAVALRKLRAHLARGDISATEERLTTLEWAVVDILLLYDTSLLSVSSLPQLAQRAALQRTFELVQRFQLEPEHGGAVLPHTWTLAADSYSRNGVELSALALQRRWHEMKTLARRLAGGPATPSILQAIVHRRSRALNLNRPHNANRSQENVPRASDVRAWLREIMPKPMIG